MKKQIVNLVFILVGMTAGFSVFDLVPTPFSPNTSAYEPSKDILNRIYIFGDTNAYNWLVRTIHARTPNLPFHLLASLEMANRFHYERANYDVYACIRDIHELNGLGEMDKRTYSLAMSFLRKGAALNDERAVTEMKRLGLDEDIHYVQIAMNEYLDSGGDSRCLTDGILEKLYVGDLAKKTDYHIKDCWSTDNTKYWIPILPIVDYEKYYNVNRFIFK